MDHRPTQPVRLLLIDGNNLAHFLYTNLASGQKMTALESLRLIEHLSSYARTYTGQVSVELILDRAPGPIERLPDNLRVLPAEYPQTADDLLLDRFWFHYTSGRDCLVISNDEAILDEVGAAMPPGMPAPTLRVSLFVRRPGWNTPVLREPDDLPVVRFPHNLESQPAHPLPLSASVYFRIIQASQSSPALPQANQAASQTGTETLAPPENEVLSGSEVFNTGEDHSIPIEPPDSPIAQEEPGQVHDPLPDSPQHSGEPMYFLNLAQWPVVEGVRFLLNAFCDRHRTEIEELVRSVTPGMLTSADLRGLADYLLHTCGDEPGFARQGALMVRARLALLQARGEPLTLSQLAGRTGLKLPGLRGRLKAKAGQWIEILPDSDI